MGRLKKKTAMRAIILGCMFAFTLPAYALSGNKLYELCESNSPTSQQSCDFYIWGNIEGLMYMNRLSSSVSKDIDIAICLPNGVTPQQLMDVGKKYLKDHPEKRNESASHSIFFALSEAFGCK